MSARAHGDPNPPIQSPYDWSVPDYQGNKIGISIVFDNATRALLSADAFRDASCVYKKIYLGLGPNGTPDDSPKFLNVASGTRHLNTQQLNNAFGFTTIEQFLSVQITAGP